MNTRRVSKYESVREFINRGLKQAYWLSEDEKDDPDAKSLFDFAAAQAEKETPFLEFDYEAGEMCFWHGCVYVTVVTHSPHYHHRVYMLREDELYYVNSGSPREIVGYANDKMVKWSYDGAAFADIYVKE